jgi:hypothetical protein
MLEEGEQFFRHVFSFSIFLVEPANLLSSGCAFIIGAVQAVKEGECISTDTSFHKVIR